MTIYRLVALMAAMSLSACNSEIPAIGAGLPGDLAEAKRAFDQRVKDRFPVGMDQSLLRVELNHEKFTKEAPLPPQYIAQVEVQTFPCRDSWTIKWTENAGKIAVIRGEYRSACL
jgi:hypothetical protein